MFKQLGAITSMLKNASAMRGQMAEMSEKLAQIRVEGAAGGGMVKVEANGQQKVTAVHIDPSLLDANDREVLEDLVAAAVNQAFDKAKTAATEAMSELTEGLGLGDMMKQLSAGAMPPDDET